MEQDPYIITVPGWYTLCDFLGLELDDLSLIIKEHPDAIRSWWTERHPFTGNYFTSKIDNSATHISFQKYTQLVIVLDHIHALNKSIGCEKKVRHLLTRERRKLGKRSFADIARGRPHPIPEYNGFQELLERLQDWCDRKEIVLPDHLIRV